jgi:hypothetical protein
MWSKKFVWVGLSSGVLFAASAAFAIWFTLSFALAAAANAGQAEARVMLNFAVLVFVGAVVYPACWFYTIQRSRDYSKLATFNLVILSYYVSCLAVAALFCLAAMGVYGTYFVLAVVRGTVKWNWQAMTGLFFLMFVLPPLGGISLAIFGGFITLIPFVVIAPLIAFLHRCLLLAMFFKNRFSSSPRLDSGSRAALS